MDKKDLLKKLKGFIYSEFGTAKAYAESKGVTSAFVSAVLNDKKEPTPNMLDDIKMIKKVVYFEK